MVLVGAGRLATNLGPALLKAGHRVEQVYSRTAASAEALAGRVGCPAVTRLADVVADADVYVLSVKDDALPLLIPELVRGREQALFVHTAGSMPLSILSDNGCRRCGVLYPMQTFSKERPVDFSTVPIFIEADFPADEQVLYGLAASLTASVRVLSSEARRSLHLSAVFACNFVNHCYARAAELLERQGVPFEVMLPLVDETAAKVHHMAPRLAQTGPAVRYDRQVMERHLALLHDIPDAAAEYELLSSGIHRLALQTEADGPTAPNDFPLHRTEKHHP